MLLSYAFDGFLMDKEVSLSQYTIRNYISSYRKLRVYLGDGWDRELDTLDHAMWTGFFRWLRGHTFTLDGVAPRPRQTLSAKSICNIHTNFSAFYTWAVDVGVVDVHEIRSIPRPKHHAPVIVPFVQDELKALLQACWYTAAWKTSGTRTRRSLGQRDAAIVMMLTSTGLRVSELCALTRDDCDMKHRSLMVRHGKGNKARQVFFGNRARKQLWRYLATRSGDDWPELFVTSQGDAVRRGGVQRMVRRLGERADVPNVYPHRFRHTFAINYLRNGGDVLTLQNLMGHSTLEMVRRYARVAAEDCAAVHRAADPVDCWRL